ncbi:MAG: NTP transferase domain-containing protein [Gammaproteobacteria bacterium]|nr:NTP transferase domain-containing protein [Gammaproteobacteria bacterium]MDH5304101.1 NTP transferase domain-containing protein [Gammaproteobacteria bacterium]MDH5322534.1 NTP transferase domain-containing protein [Gammaproteobacteria bacterium]
MSANALYGLVLAGGESRRMGRDKALLPRNGESQLAYLAALLGRLCDRVFVSARSTQQHDAERSRFDLVVDHYQNLGPMAGILSALEDYPDKDWLVVACDLPNVDEPTLRFLLEHRSAAKPFTAFRSSHDGLPEPLCAIYKNSSANVLRNFVAEGVICPRKVMMRSDSHLLEQPDPGALDNINTPDDLERSVLGAGS